MDWEDAVDAPGRGRARRWPERARGFVGLRVPVDRFREAFDFRGIKATLAFAD